MVALRRSGRFHRNDTNDAAAGGSRLGDEMPQALLDGRTTVITGAAQGIGFAIAEMFVSEGSRVVIGDRDGAAAADAAVQLGGSQIAIGERCDVTEAADIDRLLAAAGEHFSPVDVMVNNAGVLRDATMRTMTEEQFDTVIAVHLKGTWNGTRKAAAIMRERKRGAIINMSSIAGKVGNPGQTNYAAAKAGIVGLTKAAAKEMARHGVRVNAIQPGLIRTAMTAALPTHIWDDKVAVIPMGRAGEVSEIASVALFLASDMSSFMTGGVLEVDGGRYM
jgi:3-oxoacyl-[acyl-carrier protein] reductase